MAILWSQNIDGNHYEVRSAGASLRLYRNGVHHSQYNPNRPLSGGIWDLLTLTSLFRAPEKIAQALILGFGAGAAGRLLMELANPDRIVGIDLDPIHLSIADSFFQCANGCDLLAADAVEWVRTNDLEHDFAFDWILDDLYSEDRGVPVRCGPTTKVWFRRLADRLTDDGMLVVNFVEPQEIAGLPLLTDRWFAQRFPHVVQLSMPAYDNRVLALSRKPLDPTVFDRHLKAFYQRFPACRKSAAKYRLQTLRSGL